MEGSQFAGLQLVLAVPTAAGLAFAALAAAAAANGHSGVPALLHLAFMIAQLAGQTAEAGWIPFLTFMALISVNLAFINILPIPGLDGGHIMIHLIEGILRRPLTMKTRITIQQIGMAFLLMLMVTVVFNDISRLFN